VNRRAAHFKNAAIVAAGSYFESAIGLLIGVVVARSLGPEQFGSYAFAIWLMGWLITGCSQTLTTVNIKFAAEALGRGDHQEASNIYGYLLKVQHYGSLCVLAIYVMAFWLIHPAEWESTLLLYLAVSCTAIWSKARFWMESSISNSQERFEPENLALACVALVNLVAVAVWAWFFGSLIGYVAIFAGTGLLSLVLVRRLMRKRLQFLAANGPVPAELKRRIWSQVKATAALVLITLLGNRSIETMMLKLTEPTSVVGFFALAGTLTKGAVDLLAGGLNSVLLPAMSRRIGQSNIKGVGAMLNESARYYSFLGFFIVGAAITFAPGATSLLYGSKYDAAIPAVVWSLVIAGLTSVSAALYAFQTSTERQSDRLTVAVFTILGNLIFGLALIPKFGLNGALASLGATRLLNLLLSWLYVRKFVKSPLPLKIMALQSLAMAIGLLASAGLSQLSSSPYLFLAGFAAFLFLFLFFSVLLRTWRKVDFDLVLSVLNKVGIREGLLPRLIVRLRDRFSLKVL
jgi:O-antigen/teichoic acid export membrane protein